ncbi:MAG: outer membrane beta-barrel protein [Polyangiales bacterium]
MTRASLAIAASFAVAFAVVTPSARADDPFGKSGDVVVGGTVSFARANADPTFGPATTISVNPRVDLYVADHWFVGVAPTLLYSTFDVVVTNNDGTTGSATSTSKTFGVGARFGRVIPITDRFALRPVIGLSVLDTSFSDTGEADTSQLRVSATARLELAYALTEHVFLTSGFGLLSATFGDAATNTGSGIVSVGATPGYSASLGALGFGLEGRL